MDALSLANEAKRVDSEGFLQLVNHIIQLLSEEKKTVGDLQILGKLVQVPQREEATVIGDIHGDLESLSKILKMSSFIEKAKKNNNVLMIFLGDYGDRGPYSSEVYYIVLSLKSRFPEKVILLRGNHEGPADLLAYPHDLPVQLQRRFGYRWQEIYEELTKLFEHLYVAVFVREKCIMLHGGVPSKAENIEDVAYAFEKHPSESHLEEILWSDPREGISGTYPSPRGAGRIFGEDITERFLHMFGVGFLIRGHESADNGYKINHHGKVLTLFSRKGVPYYNRSGAYLRLNLSETPRDVYGLMSTLYRF